MAWKDCPECAERIEANAGRCRHCGARLKARKRGPAPRGGGPAEGVDPAVPDVGVAGALAVFGAFVGFAVGSLSEGWLHGVSVVAGALLGLGVARWLERDVTEPGPSP